MNSKGASDGAGNGTTRFSSAAVDLGTTTICPDVHSTASVGRTAETILIRVMPSGTDIGEPDGTKSSQFVPEASCNVEVAIAAVGAVDGPEESQQKCVLPSSKPGAGIESVETNDCLTAALPDVADVAGKISETR